jgi:hypothetical protein
VELVDAKIPPYQLRGPPRGTCRGEISRCNRLQKPPDRHMSLFSFSRASDWMGIMGHCFTPGHCHFAPRHLLVRGVLNSHRNLESHQGTLPSSSSQYICSQGIAEHRNQSASPNCFLSRHDQRGSSDAMDDSQITCDLKDKANSTIPPP